MNGTHLETRGDKRKRCDEAQPSGETAERRGGPQGTRTIKINSHVAAPRVVGGSSGPLPVRLLAPLDGRRDAMWVLFDGEPGGTGPLVRPLPERTAGVVRRIHDENADGVRISATATPCDSTLWTVSVHVACDGPRYDAVANMLTAPEKEAVPPGFILGASPVTPPVPDDGGPPAPAGLPRPLPRPNAAVVVPGDLLTCDASHIVHQCNCVSDTPAFFAAKMFEAFPWADVYTERVGKGKSMPGNIILRGNGRDQRYVVNFLAQYYPGPPKYRSDSAEHRREWFKTCLRQLARLSDLESVAFPWEMGCGISGGDWQAHQRAIDEFAQQTQAYVYIVRPRVGRE